VNLRGIWGETSSDTLNIPSTDFLAATSYIWSNVRFAFRGDVFQVKIDLVDCPVFRTPMGSAHPSHT